MSSTPDPELPSGVKYMKKFGKLRPQRALASLARKIAAAGKPVPTCTRELLLQSCCRRETVPNIHSRAYPGRLLPQANRSQRALASFPYNLAAAGRPAPTCTRSPTCCRTRKFGSRSEPNFPTPNVHRLNQTRGLTQNARRAHFKKAKIETF